LKLVLSPKQRTVRATPSNSANHACAVRLGKVLLYSMPVDQLLSSSSFQLRQIVTVNSEIFVYAHENAAFQTILNQTINTIDGRILQLLCSLFYAGRNLEKLSGSDFIYDLADHAMKHGERLFLLGAEEACNRKAVQILKARCSGLLIEGYAPAFCSSIHHQEWNDAILKRIARFRPAHLVVCFGPVKQEMWVAQNADSLLRLGVRCAYGMGGTLDFVSGTKRRAPKWVQTAGAEWLFRLISEPRRRFTRTLKMFKMPFFALKFHHREVRVLEAHESAVTKAA